MRTLARPMETPPRHPNPKVSKHRKRPAAHEQVPYRMIALLLPCAAIQASCLAEEHVLIDGPCLAEEHCLIETRLLDEEQGGSDSLAPLTTVAVPLLPEGAESAPCDDETILFDFEPGSRHYSDLNAFWAMWFAERAFYSDRETTQQELSSIGFQRYQSLQSMTGLQGYVAGSQTAVVVAFRGSTEVRDWIVNLGVPLIRGRALGLPGKLHAGFAASIWFSLRSIEDTVREFADAGQHVWVTGHSLGGAQATLVATRLARRGFKMGPLYTFAAPRVGDTEFAMRAATDLNGNVFRVVNERDLVPRLPPAGIAAAEAAGVFRGLFGLPHAVEKVLRNLDYGHFGEMYWWPTEDAVYLEPQTIPGDEEDIDYWSALDGPLDAILSNLEQGRRHQDLSYVCKMNATRH